MAALQRAAVQFNANTNGWSEGAAAIAVSDQFPAGLRVLVVDDDTSCLRILEKMLRRLMYQVTICSQADVALAILRERKGCFDLVLSDVHMPGMDGYKLLEHVGLEMDLPVIMMSSDGRTSAVMMGINHGACDYLIKPIRLEELKNIWQHVVRKKCNENREIQQSGTLEDNDQHKSRNDDLENSFAVKEGSEGSSKHQRKRSIAREDDEDDVENGDLDPTTSKKPRVVWSVELHQQFVSAVNQLGIDKAVPKRILELMNVPGLTRENVASHLQKFRLYLKRLSGVAPQGSMPNTLCSNVQPNLKLGTLGRCDIQTLAASGQIHPQTLAALFGRPVGNIVAPVDQSGFLQSSLQGPKSLPVEHVVAYGHPVVKCSSSDISKHFQHPVVSSEDLSFGFGVWISDDNIGTVGGNGIRKLNSQNENLPVDICQQKFQRQQKQQLPESNRPINGLPSCLVVLSPSSSGFGTTNSPASVNQNIGFPNAATFNQGILSPPSNSSSLHFGQVSEANPETVGILSGYPAQGPLSPCASACSVNADNNVSSVQISNNNTISTTSRPSPGLASNICGVQGSYKATKSNEVINQTPRENLGFVHRGNPFPSRFAIDEFESSLNNPNHGKTLDGERIKQELDVDPMDSIRTGTSVLQQFPSNDLMSVFTK